MSAEDNGKKARAGVNAEKLMQQTVVSLEEIGAITQSEIRPRYGYEDYDPEQFSAHERVVFADDEQAIAASQDLD
ncbi:MAG: hypothetical protein PUE49_06805 [Eggerthellales bacterium]|nr:hypothetical protein [Eggerthellales bacterium]